MLLAGNVLASEDSSSDESSGDELAVGADPVLVEQPLFTTPASPAFRDWEKHTRVSWHIFPYSPCNDTTNTLPQLQSVDGTSCLTLTRFKARTFSLVVHRFCCHAPQLYFITLGYWLSPDGPDGLRDGHWSGEKRRGSPGTCGSACVPSWQVTGYV